MIAFAFVKNNSFQKHFEQYASAMLLDLLVVFEYWVCTHYPLGLEDFDWRTLQPEDVGLEYLQLREEIIQEDKKKKRKERRRGTRSTR